MLLIQSAFLVVLSLFTTLAAVASEPSVTVDARVLPLMTADSFAEFLSLAKKQGTRELIFQDLGSRAVKVNSVDDSYPGGDAYFLQGLSDDESDDKKMRQNEYKSLFPIVDYLSQRRMRMTINLKANTSDLRAVFKSDRPSIVIWSSHGSEEYFFGANGEAIPHSIFKYGTGSVYQFILSACYGRKALDNYYLKELPKGAKLNAVGWSGLTNSNDMISHLMSDEWDMYENRTEFRNAGLRCDGNKLVRTSDGSEFATYGSASYCGSAVIQAQENFVCIEEDKKTAIWSISRREKIWGETYDKFYDCAERLTRAFDKKVCRRKSGEYRIVDSVSDKVGSESYKTMRLCEEALTSGISL